MDDITLYTSTGDLQIDTILRGAIGILETVFPERIQGYYLHGSFVDGTAIPTSDIDLFLIFKGSLSAEERDKLQRVMYFNSLTSPFMVEMMAFDEISLLQNGHFRIKSASQFLWGDDIRHRMPEQTLAQYLCTYASFPFVYSARMLRNSGVAVFPLVYPQPEGEFYGYDQQQLPPKGESLHNIKKLVTGVCWAATVIIAWQAGKTVSGKRNSVQLYREYVHDEWMMFIEEMYEWGNRQWHYLVPSGLEERQRLRDLCARTLAFENHYLRHYQAYLLTELQQDDARKRAAMLQLKYVVYPD